MDHIAQAREIVAEHVPAARIALLTGSAARGAATASSDLDIYAVIDGPPAPYRKTLLHDGRLVELFVNSDESLKTFAENEIAERSPTTIHMCAHSAVLIGTEDAEALRSWALGIWRKGPAPLFANENETKRYMISSLIDDLADAAAPDERSWIAAELAREVADFFLIANRRWTGSGKWLARRLREADPAVADRLSGAYSAALSGDPQPLIEAARFVIEPFGGYLQAGYGRGID